MNSRTAPRPPSLLQTYVTIGLISSAASDGQAVTPQKRARYERIAGWYLHDECEFVDIPVRFDVIALLVAGKDRALVRHYRHAFECGW